MTDIQAVCTSPEHASPSGDGAVTIVSAKELIWAFCPSGADGPHQWVSLDRPQQLERLRMRSAQRAPLA